jgi:hypothetical protein
VSNVIRTVVHAFRAEFGKNPKRNPWPKCRWCYRRTNPVDVCGNSMHLPHTICAGCCPYSGVHPDKKKDETHDDD